jgi:D-hydroxyproline dehydrogenase subunit beta
MKPHILIVGAGIIGSAIANRLAPKARVTVLEAATPATLASGNSFGWINASFFHNPTHHRLRVEAIAAWARLGPVADVVQWTGTLWWEETGTKFDAMATTLHDLGYPVCEVAPPEFRQREPNVATPPDRSLLFPGEASVDAAAQTTRLLAAAADHGAQIWTGTRVTGFAQSDAGVIGVLTDQGPVFADHVILATGTATEGLLDPLGVTLPMLRRVAVLLHSQSLPPVIHHILVRPEGELRQDAAGRLLIPAVVSHQSDDSETLVATPGHLADMALARTASLLPGHDLRWSRVTQAMRPMPADGLPAVGQVAPGLTVAVMHSGVTLAALMGELVADEVLGKGPSPWLAPYRPARFD